MMHTREKRFPDYQYTDDELDQDWALHRFNVETKKLLKLFPRLNQNPGCQGCNDPNGDVVWVYPDVSDLGGDGHFAFKDISPGEVILRVNNPLVAVPNTSKLSETCSTCFLWEPGAEMYRAGYDRENMKLKACSGCKVAKYCGKVSHSCFICNLYHVAA